MKQCKGYKYRIYPTSAQQYMLAHTFGCVRAVYNHFLSVRSEAWKTSRESVSYTQTSKMLTCLKHTDGFTWLTEVDSMALQESLRDLDNAYKNFFAKRAGYPKFHSKRSSFQSYRTRNQSGGIRFEGGKLILPKLGAVKIKKSRDFDGRILNATVSKAATGKYFVSLCVEEDVVAKPCAGNRVGIDVGIKDFYSDSNGNVIANPRTLSQHERKLHREQRRLSRMMESNITGYRTGPKGGRVPVYAKPVSECKNIQKQRRKVALIHEKVYNIRTDFLHKQSTKLVNENQVIAIEDLNVKGMVRNHKLAKAISDVSWSRFSSILEYKAFEHGAEIIRVPTFYPSSQLCSCCGYKNPLVKNLRVREWDCPVCGSHHNRDENAAVNILNKALQTI